MAEGRGSCHLHPAGRTWGGRTKEHISTPLAGRPQSRTKEGEAWGQDKGIFVYQLLLPGASAREAKSGAKRHHNSSISDPAGTFILSFSRYSLCYRVAGSAPGASGENAEQREGNRQKQYNNKCKVTFPLPATAELLPGSAGRGGPGPVLDDFENQRA